MSGGSDVKETKPVDDVEDCVICFEALANSDRTVVTLKCRHQFHLDCIGSEFNQKNKMICPCCRRIENGQWLYANPVDPSYPPVINTNWNFANAVDPSVIYWNWDYSEDEVGVDNQSLQEMQPIEQSESGLFANDVVDPPVINMDSVDTEVGPVDDQTSQEMPPHFGQSDDFFPLMEGEFDGDDVNMEYVEAEARVEDQSLQEMQPVEESESGLPPDVEVFVADRALRDHIFQFIVRTRGTSNSGELGFWGDNNGAGHESSNGEGDGGGRSLGEGNG